MWSIIFLVKITRYILGIPKYVIYVISNHKKYSKNQQRKEENS